MSHHPAVIVILSLTVVSSFDGLAVRAGEDAVSESNDGAPGPDDTFPAPPLFLVPPPPPLILTNGSANSYVWRLVPTNHESISEHWKALADCSFAVPTEEKDSKANGSDEGAKIRRRCMNNNHTDIDKINSSTSSSIDDAEVTKSCRCACNDDATRLSRAEVRGPAGPPGPRGPRGQDGVPGLVVFANAAAMHAVSLEGLIAYRLDVKQLFFRDHLTWRSLRVSKCGDGLVDVENGEMCDDGNDDIHDDCLGCRRSYCGDGVRNARSEQCDGRDFGLQSCASASKRRRMTGTLTCTANCRISRRRCRYIGNTGRHVSR